MKPIPEGMEPSIAAIQIATDLDNYSRQTLVVMRDTAAAHGLWDNVAELDRRIALIDGTVCAQ